MELANWEKHSTKMAMEESNNNKDMNPATDGEEEYFTAWRRKNPWYNKWGTTLIDSKEARAGKRGMQEEEI
jgi:hypothetical protein